MEVTNDIVRDLLPVYLAGEASADTRAVVEAYLKKDEKLREIVEAAGSYSPPPLEGPAGLEVRSLERTRRLLGRKNLWLGFALIFSIVPLNLEPLWLAEFIMVVGLCGWAAFLATCRKLNVTGLEAPRRWSLRILWGEVGLLLGIVTGDLIQRQIGLTGVHWPIYVLGVVTPSVAVWIGERLHQIPSGDEIGRPTTLFGAS